MTVVLQRTGLITIHIVDNQPGCPKSVCCSFCLPVHDSIFAIPDIDKKVVKCEGNNAIYYMDEEKSRRFNTMDVYTSWGKPTPIMMPCTLLMATPNGSEMPCEYSASLHAACSFKCIFMLTMVLNYRVGLL
jgi:hypothetical protein